MVLRQYDFIKRVPYDYTPGGYYYWSSVYYYDTDDFVSNLATFNRAQNVDRLHTIDQVSYVKCRVKEPPGRATTIQTIDMSLLTGLITSGSDPYSLINIVHIHTIFDDGRWSRKLLRMPTLDSWIEGDQLSTFAQARAASLIANMRQISGHPAARNLYGGKCVAGTFSPTISMWQLRHGTKRRQSTFA